MMCPSFEEVVKTRADIMWLQNKTIYQAFVRPTLAAEAARELETRLG